MILGYEEQGEGAIEAPDEIDEALAKQAAHRLNTGPTMETKGRALGTIAGIVSDAIGFVSFNPSEHPRDYRGRFLTTGDNVDLPDGRRGVVETLNADGTMSVRTDGGITSANAPEVRKVGETGGISVDLHDGRAGIADRTDPNTGDIMVRLPDNTEVSAKPGELTPAPEPGDVTAIQYGIDGKQIVQGANVRDAAGHVGIAKSVAGGMVTVDFGGDTRSMAQGVLTPTAGTKDSEFPSPLDERLVNFKPSRNLDDPTKTVPLAELLPNARYVAYSQVPFLADLHQRMGVDDPLTHDVADYMQRRDEVLNAQPLTSVPYDHVVVTQKSVNRDRVTQIAMDPSTGGTKPAHFVRYNGETYVLNGHHRVAAQIINGDATVMGRVLDLDKAKAEDPTMDPFDAAGPDAAGLPAGIGRGAVVLDGQGRFAFITDASDASRMRAWNDDTRQWVTLSVGDIGSIQVPNTNTEEARSAEWLIRARAKDAGASRVDKPKVVAAELSPEGPHPRGALAPVDGADSVESLGDGRVPRAAFAALMFPEGTPDPLDPNSPLPTNIQRGSAAQGRAVDGIAPGLADVPDSLMAELTGMPMDATYAITSVGGVIKITEPHREYLAGLPGMVMDVPGDDPRVVEYRRRELAGQYINLWYHTSGDGVPRANALQESARDLFGIEGGAKSTSFNLSQDMNTHDVLAHEGPALRAFLAATYAATQEYLTRNGVDSIVGYRGSSFRRGQEPDWTHQPQTDAPLRPLSSWTASPTHAIKFEDNHGEDGVGVIRAASIPRDRILSIPVTGPGAFGENEFVVIGGPGISTVVDPIGESVLAQAALNETPNSPTWHSPATPISDMPSRADIQTPNWGDHGFAWHDWADFNLGGLPSTKGEDFTNTTGLSDIPSTTPHLVMGDWRSEAKAAVVADLVKEMELVPDDAMFRGVDDGIPDSVTHVALYAHALPGSPQGTQITPIIGDRTYNPDYYDTVPVDDPRVRAARRELVINAMVSQWASTSNDSSAESLAMQEIAAEHFGVTDTANWDLEYASGSGSGALRAEIDQIKADRGEAITAFLQAQYDLTQRRYAAAGITTVDVYRGMGWAGFPNKSSGDKAPDWAQVDGDANIPLRPLSSWTLDRDTADEFGRNSGQGSSKQVNVVVGTTVPVERILATPRTGVGALNEWEVVVLGGPLDVAVRTSVIPPLTDEEANATPAGTLDREADFQTAVRMATTDERRKQLMERARSTGGWAAMIPTDWWPKNTGLSEDGLTFDGAKDEDSQERKVDRWRRAAEMTMHEIEAGTARDLQDAISAEEYGSVYEFPFYGSYQRAKRRADLMDLFNSGKFHLPGVHMPADWAKA